MLDGLETATCGSLLRGDKARMLSPDKIVTAIRSGHCRKISVPGFQNVSYFADPDGYIYSLNRPTEPKCVEAKRGKGLMYVTLFEQEGQIRKLMVGDIIAHTFLAEEGQDDTLCTVLYKDGNPDNNAVNNLEWATPQEQQKQLREQHLEKSGAATNGAAKNTASIGELDGVPFIPAPENDPLLDQLHMTQKRLESEQSTSARLREALEPFATFHLSPSDGAALGKKVVLEANRGGNNHSVLTVQHFRKAKSVFERPAGDDK